ncbi:CENP-B N-terminal DNA-binding domain [Popillia japonica]|uniref:CENP-B N-terminal DNA-binding domain n=1 Tax=Popillia japonica TaxID=7064 RepID=A0AAW1MLF7_POPJA
MYPSKCCNSNFMLLFQKIIVRTYKKKRTKPEVIEEDMTAAIRAVMELNMSIRRAAAAYGIVHTALYYRLKKNNCGERQRDYASKYTAKQVFTKQQEELLEVYILKCSKISYGLTYTDIRKLAYSYAILVINALIQKIGAIQKWLVSIGSNRLCDGMKSYNSKMAGFDWVKSFMRRHEKLTLRKPENTSLARATTFNNQYY